MAVGFVANATAIRPFLGVNVQMIVEMVLKLKPSMANIAFVSLDVQVPLQVSAVGRCVGSLH